MSDPSKKSLSIPAWQQSSKSETESAPTGHPHGSDPTTQMSHAELLEQAREFLKDESIRGASREKKVAFLQKKGLQASDIEQLLSTDSTDTEQQSEELKTVHDSTATTTTTSAPKPQPEEPAHKQPTTPSIPSPPTPTQLPQRDIPPIITYPEFLLKPQKPPPLITVSRLVNAAYAFTGLATLTYATSKYLVEPMLSSLTDARHSLASTTLTDLETLNHKLESTVSHVPYIAPSTLHKHYTDDDADSIISDPTELFHRDIATQTTPSLSRRQSHSLSNEDKLHLDATTQQVQRLSSLHETLTSLVHSLDPKELPYLPPPANKKLHETISDFQSVLDRLESTYNPFRSDYYSSIYASAEKKGGKDNDVAAKVRVEIRNLKGLFLSARNFPTAPRPMGSYSGR